MAEKQVSPKRYDDPADVKQRLDGTFIRYKGEAVKCNYYDGLSVVVHPIHEQSTLKPGGTIVHSSSVELDISSIQLGFLAKKGKGWPVVIRRRPIRRYKQGVCIVNMDGLAYNGPDHDPGRINDRDLQGYCANEPFYNMLLNKYPTIAECLAVVKAYVGVASSCHVAAVSKDYCFHVFEGVGRLLDLQLEEVGVWDKDHGYLVVNDWWATPTMVDRLRLLGIPLKGG